MESWIITSLFCLPCWNGWDIAMGLALPKLGWLLHKFSVGKQIRELHNSLEEKFEGRNIIDNLERFEEAMAKWEKRQNEKGQIDPTQSTDDYILVSTALDITEKRWKDWLSINESILPEKRAGALRKEAVRSIRLIREHGHKKAKEIRREKTENEETG